MHWCEVIDTFKSQNFAQQVYDVWLVIALLLLVSCLFWSPPNSLLILCVLPAAVVGLWVRLVVYLKG